MSSEQCLLKERNKGYNKGKGLSRALLGGNYQVNIAALFVILSYKHGNISYNLSFEDVLADKFDDIVFKYILNSRLVCNFVQAKHKESTFEVTFEELFKQKGDFSLRTYFEAYRKISKLNSFKELDKANCIVYTPASLAFNNPKVQEMQLKFRDISENFPFLGLESWKKGRVYRLEVNEYITNFLKGTPGIGKIDTSRIENFLLNFSFAVNQPTKEELDEVLLKEASNIDVGTDLATLKLELCGLLLDWIGRYEVNNHAKYFTEVEGGKLLMKLHTGSTIASVKLEENLKLCNLVQYEDFSCRDCHVILMVTKSPTLTCNKLHQSLHNVPILSLKTLTKLSHTVSDFSFFLNAGDISFVVCMEEEAFTDNTEVLKSFLQCFVTKIEKLEFNPMGRQGNLQSPKLVLVVGENCNENLKQVVHNIPYVEIEDETYNLNSFTEESRELLLQKRVKFQGVDVTLLELLDEQSQIYVDSETIIKLSSHQEVTIGKQLQQVKDIFIPRTLYINNTINNACLLENNEDIFAIFQNPTDEELNAKDEELIELPHMKDVCYFTDATIDTTKNIILLDSGQISEQYRALCELFPNKNVHQLRFERSADTFKFFWCKSNGSLGKIQEFVDRAVKSNVSIEEVFHTQITKKVVISAEPGMGKSILLTHLAHLVKKTNPKMWVIRLNLADIRGEISCLNTKSGFRNFAQIISKIEGSNLTEHLLQHCLEHKDDFCLLLDGFDEMQSEQRERVLHMLKGQNDGRLVITTRLHFENKLETAFNSIAFHIKPFSEADQVSYLVELWKRSLSLSEQESENSKIYAQKIIKYVFNMANKRIVGVLGIPLLTKLLGEVCESNCKDFCSLSGSQEYKHEETQIFDILSLYEKYVEKKYDDFLKDNFKVDSPLFVQNLKLLKDECENRNIQVAILERFSKENVLLKYLPTDKKVGFNLTEDQLLRIGILQKTNNELFCIHRSFAEYFVAMFLAELLKEGHLKDKQLNNFLKRKVFTSGGEVIRLFLDISLCPNEVHKIAIFNDVHAANRLSSDLQETCDILGRTPVYLAAFYGRQEMIDWLVQHGYDMRSRDILFDLSPYKVARSHSHMHICMTLLCHGAVRHYAIKDVGDVYLYICKRGNDDDIEKFFDWFDVKAFGRRAMLLEKDTKGNTGLHLAAFGNHIKIAQVLFDKLVGCVDNMIIYDVISCTNKQGYTPLHILVIQGKVDFLSTVLDYVEKAHLSLKQIICIGPLLHIAAAIGRKRVIIALLRKLLKENKDNFPKVICALDGNKNSILHVAVINGRMKMVKFLTEVYVCYKVDISSLRGEHNRTALHCAAIRGNFKMTRILFEAAETGYLRGNCSKFSALDVDELTKTSLQYAEEKGHSEIYKYLENKTFRTHLIFFQ